MSGIKSNGVLLSAIFAPYVAGTTKARLSGINDDAGELSNQFSKLSYGTAAPATDIESAGDDLNTLYAAYGTVSIALPINGNTYTAFASTISSSVTASVYFQMSTAAGWQVAKNEKGTVTILATGALPPTSYSVQYTDTYLAAPGDTGPGTAYNAAPAFTVITSSLLLVSDSVSVSGSGGSKQTTHSINIQIKNVEGSVISNTTITFVALADGAQ